MKYVYGYKIFYNYKYKPSEMISMKLFTSKKKAIEMLEEWLEICLPMKAKGIVYMVEDVENPKDVKIVYTSHNYEIE